MNIVIIDADGQLAGELDIMLRSLNLGIHVSAILCSVASAVKWLSEHPAPDLIITETQLGDETSFDIFQTIDVNVPIIFCTAYTQYAIRAFDVNSIAYLLKPIDQNTLSCAILKYERLRELFNTREVTALPADHVPVLEKSVTKQYVLVYYKEKIIPIRTADIHFVYAANGMVCVYIAGQNEYMIHYTLDQLEEILDPFSFFKANRQFIINRNMIVNVEHYYGRRLLVKLTMETPIMILVSKIKAIDFLRWLES